MTETQIVILLHGMGRTKYSMRKIAKQLSQTGFQVVNINYPSTKKPIATLIQNYIEPIYQQLLQDGASKIHFVTHSLGGILVRQFLQTHTLPSSSRIVMLSPPNRGSEIVDKFKHRWWFKLINGSAGQVLGTGNLSLPNSLKPVDAEIGIITGNRSSDPWFSYIIPGENDGKVSVASARLSEMKDFEVVKVGHTFIMNNSNVIEQIICFLKKGKFQK